MIIPDDPDSVTFGHSLDCTCNWCADKRMDDLKEEVSLLESDNIALRQRVEELEGSSRRWLALVHSYQKSGIRVDEVRETADQLLEDFIHLYNEHLIDAFKSPSTEQGGPG